MTMTAITVNTSWDLQLSSLTDIQNCPSFSWIWPIFPTAIRTHDRKCFLFGNERLELILWNKFSQYIHKMAGSSQGVVLHTNIERCEPLFPWMFRLIFFFIDIHICFSHSQHCGLGSESSCYVNVSIIVCSSVCTFWLIVHFTMNV